MITQIYPISTFYLIPQIFNLIFHIKFHMKIELHICPHLQAPIQCVTKRFKPIFLESIFFILYIKNYVFLL